MSSVFVSCICNKQQDDRLIRAVHRYDMIASTRIQTPHFATLVHIAIHSFDPLDLEEHEPPLLHEGIPNWSLLLCLASCQNDALWTVLDNLTKLMFHSNINLCMHIDLCLEVLLSLEWILAMEIFQKATQFDKIHTKSDSSKILPLGRKN